jgi:hypothetical protein
MQSIAYVMEYYFYPPKVAYVTIGLKTPPNNPDFARFTNAVKDI